MATFKNMQAIQFIEESAESIMNGTNDYENVVHNIVPTPGKRKAAEMGSDDESEGETPANMIPETRNLAGMKPAKKTKGRVKIKMEFIENKIRRYTTFSKRKTGIMKKAYELSTLTGTQVMLLVASETGHVYTFATRKLQPMITSESGKALIQTCLNSPDQDGPPVMLPHTTSNIPSGRGGDQRMNPAGYEEPELGYVEDDDSSKSSSSVPSVSAKPTPPPPLTAHNTGPILPVAKPSVYIAPRSAPTDIPHHPHHHHSSAATTPAASPSPAPPPAHMPTNNHTSSATTSTHQLAHVGGVTAGAVGVSTAPIQLTSTPVTMTTPSIAQTPLMYMASPPPSATAGKPLAINLPAGFVLPPGIPPGTPIAIGAIPGTQQHASTIYRFPTPPTSAGGGASAATAQILQIPATPTVQTATGAATKVEPSALHHQTDATSGFAALGGALGGMLSSAGLSLASTPQPSVQVIGTPQPPPAHTTPAQTTPAGITVLPGMAAVSQSGVNGSSSSSGAIAATPTPAGATMLYQTPHGALLCGTPNPLTNESSFLLNLPQTPTAGAAATATLPVQLAAAAAAVQQQGGGHPSATLAAANAEQTAGQQQYITIPVPVSLGAANQQVLQSVLSALSSDTQFFEKLQK